MSTLVTASDLMRSPHLRKHADIDVLDVRARYRQGNEVLRFARGCTRVAANAARVVNNLRPLDGAFFDHQKYIVDFRFQILDWDARLTAIINKRLRKWAI